MVPMLVLMIQVATSAPAAAPPDATPDAPIVVTGRRLEDTERALAACLARKCPPKEDMAATLAHAENQFLEGDYADARQTLAAGRGRNARFAKDYPIEVAGLTRAYARLTSLYGRTDLSRLLTIDTLDALKAGLARDDARVLMQRLENGTEYAKQGRLVAANDVYQRVEKQARAAHLPLVEGYAMLKAAVLYGAVASVEQTYRGTAREKIVKIERTTGPEMEPFRAAAKVLRAQLAAFDGDKGALDKAIAEIPPRPAAQPMLVYAPPIDNDRNKSGEEGAQRASTSITTQDAQWADVGFEIAADGTVRDIQILRTSEPFNKAWFGPAQRSLAARRYAPMLIAAGEAGPMRIERFSYVLDLVSETGSRLQSRGKGRIESLDITPEPKKGQAGTRG